MKISGAGKGYLPDVPPQNGAQNLILEAALRGLQYPVMKTLLCALLCVALVREDSCKLAGDVGRRLRPARDGDLLGGSVDVERRAARRRAREILRRRRVE